MRIRLPLNNHPVLHTSDFDEMRRLIWSATHRHPIELMGRPGPVDARVNGRMLGPISASYMSFGAPVRTNPGLIEFFLLQVVLSGTYTVRCGGDSAVLTRGEAVVFSALEDVAETQWSEDCGILAYRVGYGTYMDHLREESNVPQVEPLRFAPYMDMRSGPGHDFYTDFLKVLTHRLNRPSRVLDTPETAHEMVQQFLRMLLLAQPNNYRSDHGTVR